MKINELTRPNHGDIAEILANAGFERIGTGYYAQVYHRITDDYVLKIVSPRDQGYQAFYRFCQTNNSIHLPVFRGKFMHVTDDYCAIRMERLDKIEINNRTLDDIHAMSMVFQCNEAENKSNGWKLSPKVIQWTERNPEFTQLLIKMADLFGNKFCCDIDGANVMLRGSTYVLTDPIS